MSAPRNLLAEWARLLIESLAQAGVAHAVLSPGSRSAPLVHALTGAVDAGRLQCHTVVDERAAAFHALGIARATGQAALLVCTSGTAAAHYLPAVIEARYARVPLVALTADRPFELQDCAAPQTIDQVKLYGDHARAYHECGLPDESPDALAALRRLAVQAVATARGHAPGAVQINFRARKPLEPPPPEALRDDERALADRVSALLARPIPRVYAARALPATEAIEALAQDCLGARRGVIIAGPAPLTPRAQLGHRAVLLELAAATGFPILVEPASQLRYAPAPPRAASLRSTRYEAWLRVPALRDALAPDLVLQLGAPPTSATVERWLAGHPAARRWVLADAGWQDPSSQAHLLHAAPHEAARALCERLTVLRAERVQTVAAQEVRRWAARFAALEALAAEVTLEPGAPADAPLDEVAVVRAAIGAAPAGTVLSLGNSLPLRDAELHVAEARDLPVSSQRGANGIDGLIAGAAGLARAGRPTLLILGDVSALHDVGGLAAAHALPAPLCVLIVHNGGGRIFEQLPGGSRPDLAASLPRFTTPHATDFGHAARLYGHRFIDAQRSVELSRAVAEALAGSGCTVIQARVPPASAARAAASLVARLERALATAPTLAEPIA